MKGFIGSCVVGGIMALWLTWCYDTSRYPSCSKNSDCEREEICVKGECRGHGHNGLRFVN